MSEAENSDGFLENTSGGLDLEPKLDTHSIVALSKEYAVPAGQIAAAVKRTGRKRVVRSPSGEELPPEPEESSTGQRAAKGAARTGARRGGAKSRILEEHRALLGTVADAEVARITGVSPRTVATFRARHGSPGYQRWSDANRDRSQKRPSRIDPFVEHVGNAPDVEVAAMAGVTPQAVRNYRKKNGIAAPTRRSRRAARAPSPSRAAPPAPKPERTAPSSTAELAVGGFGWLVTFSSGERRIVSAPTATTLIARASAAGLGSVTAIERLDPML